MEVHFSPDVETRLQQVASANGKDAEQLVKDTVARMLENQARFIAGVQRGIQQADRGELVEHKDMLHRIDRLFHSVRVIRWTTEASGQLEAAVKHIEQDDPTAARNVARAVIERIGQLTTLPGVGGPGELAGVGRPPRPHFGHSVFGRSLLGTVNDQDFHRPLS